MANTTAGGKKHAALAAGVSVDEFEARTASGMGSCAAYRTWLPRGSFGLDRSRLGGLHRKCTACRGIIRRARYRPKERVSSGGRKPIPPRDGDREQGRRSVNYLVEIGMLPAPDAVPCTDRAHAWAGGRRCPGYDHHLRYGVDHHLDVQPVCVGCRRAREKYRGKQDRN